MIEKYKQQQVTMLARKAQLNDELSQIDKALGQIGAVIQYADQQAPAVPPEEAVTPAE